MSSGSRILRFLKRLGAFALAGALVLGVGLPVMVAALLTLYNLFGWESAEVDLGRGDKLVLEQLATHPFLAEYDYRIRLKRAEGTVLVADLYPNFGGRTFARLWREPNRGLVLMDGSTGFVWIDIERSCVSPGSPAADSDYPDVLTPRCPGYMKPPADELFTFGVIDTRTGRLAFHPQASARERDVDRWRWKEYKAVPLPLPGTRLRVLARLDGPYEREDGLLRLIVERGGEALIELRTGSGTFDAYSPYGVDLFWQPRGPAGGPFLRLNDDDGWLFDLGARAAYRCLSKYASQEKRAADGRPVLLHDTYGITADGSWHLLLFRADAERFDRDDANKIFLRSDADTRFLGELRLDGYGEQPLGFRPAPGGVVEDAFNAPWWP